MHLHKLHVPLQPDPLQSGSTGFEAGQPASKLVVWLASSSSHGLASKLVS